MTKVYNFFGLSALMLLTLISCPVGVMAQANASYSSIQVECLGVEMDGSQTLRVLGVGRNKTDAVEQAKKNAVAVVLFVGVRGGEGCDQRPLLPEVNARQKYEEYFDRFFVDKGEYRKFVSMEDTKRRSTKKKKSKIQEYYYVTVRVLRSELKRQLVNDGLLQQPANQDND